MLIDKLCERTSYSAMNDMLNGVTLHDLQCIDILKMIANKRSLVIYDTGTGKTLLAAMFFKLLLRENPGRLFVMFVKKDQITQTPAKLKSFAGLRTIVTTAESVQAKKTFLNQNLEEYNVLMLTHDCLHNGNILNALYEIKDKIAGIVIDEAHELNNFNSASSASVLKAMISRFEYVCALTATPIISDLMQLARLSNLLLPEKYSDVRRLYNQLQKGLFKVEDDPAFFINRKASDLGRVSEPHGYIVNVQPQDNQRMSNANGVEMFQICKGYGAINQVKALEELILKHKAVNKRGLVYISQHSILSWVCENLDKTDIRYACINGETKQEVRKEIEDKFASGFYDIILTSVTTAIDLDCEYVVFYEFTVMVNQMIGRAHRGLEPKDLDVFFIITKDTNEVDYFINNIFNKCQIIKNILGKENSAVEHVATGLGVEC